ncbi:MAG: ABC transporter ATP-binding protein [Chloroflexi bacterium]|nr:ABC transporter ATP-binding protein [Chloroflexota bacterium]
MIVEIEDVSYTYPSGASAVEGVSLRVARGETIALLGQSGAGKSTLMKLVIGLLHPTRGRVLVEGVATTRTTVARLATTVGYVFQNPLHQLFAPTVADELALGPRARRTSPGAIRERVEAALAAHDLDQYRLRHPLSLSEGERRRVALASVLVGEPPLLVLDEPTVGQDALAKQRLGALLAARQAERRSTIVVTHDVEFAAAWCHRFTVMAGGRVLADGARDRVLGDRQILEAAALRPPALLDLRLRLAERGIVVDGDRPEEMADRLISDCRLPIAE